ncbi:MAG TPA: hypothetical protein VK139_01975 [Microbacteriaceae bacterium]|nr:hypothetical protein [Microbacteriaceae bacterium]
MGTTLRGHARIAALPVIGITLGWLLWMWATLLDNDVAWAGGSGMRVGGVSWSTLLRFAAIMLAGLASYLARRVAIAMAGHVDPNDVRVRGLVRYSTTFVAIALVVSSFSAIGVFLTGFATGEQTAVMTRLINLYLPIIGYAALVILLLVSLFLSRPPRVVANMPEDDTDGEGVEQRRKTLAAAFALPVATAAFAMIVGLIVVDLTGRGPEAVVWLGIMTAVGAGLLTGTRFAANSSRALAPTSDGFRASVAATRVNFVLTVLFVAVTFAMSVGYGMAAVSKLQMFASLNVNAWSDGATARGSVDANRLKLNSRIVVKMTPGDVVIIDDSVQSDDWLSQEFRIDTPLQPGDYTLEAHATAADGRDLNAKQDITVAKDGTWSSSTGGFGDSHSASLTPNAEWVTLDAAPAVGLLLLSMGVNAAALFVRNPRRRT